MSYELAGVTLDCKGLCAHSCGVIPVTASEIVALQDAAGTTFEPAPYDGPASVPGKHFLIFDRARGCCQALDDAGRCRGYEARPMICRLYGMVDHPMLRCPHGCKPSRWLTKAEADALLAESRRGR